MRKILPLSDCNQSAIESLLDAAFGTDRKTRTAYLLREGVQYIERLSFGILENHQLTASIQCWPVQLDGTQPHPTPLILVGPVAVHPDAQNSGLGHKLMHTMLDAAKASGEPPMVMIGDEEYYGRFGFSASVTSGWTLPGPWEPHRLLLRNPAGHMLPSKAALGPGSQKY